MAGLILELDPAAEASGTPLLLTDAANGWQLMAFDAPEPEPEHQWAASVDTEGSVPVSGKHQNRTVTVTLHVAKSTPAALRTALDTASQKVGKVFREGGTLKLTLPDGSTRAYDPVSASSGLVFNKRLVNNVLAEVTIRFQAKPYARGAAVTQADRVETTLPVLIATETGITGDVDATGTLIVDNDNATQDWWGLVFGGERSGDYTFTSSSGSGALFYEAESRTMLGGTFTVTRAGGSGGTPNAISFSAITSLPVALMSTQASGGGVHLTHIGEFRVYARVRPYPGTTSPITVAFEWGVGDMRRFTRNDSVIIPADLAGNFLLVDLGLVAIRRVETGTHKWEGRIIASATNPAGGEGLDIDYFMLAPVSVGFGVSQAITTTATPAVYSARDEFLQVAGALTGKSLAAGGTWAGAGDADDFTVNATARTAQRTALSDAGTGITTGRWAIAGTGTFTNVTVQADLSFTWTAPEAMFMGVFARYTDTANWLAVQIAPGTVNSVISLIKSVASTRVVLDQVIVPGHLGLLSQGSQSELRLQVDDHGRVNVWFASSRTPILSTQHADLATGGALATGKAGFVDFCQTASGSTRTYDRFAVAVPVKDAAVYAGQSIAIRHDSVIREDAAGTAWQLVSDHLGSYLKVPPAGAEAHTFRYALKPIYNPTTYGGIWIDDRIDDMSARLTIIPRYL